MRQKETTHTTPSHLYIYIYMLTARVLCYELHLYIFYTLNEGAILN